MDKHVSNIFREIDGLVTSGARAMEDTIGHVCRSLRFHHNFSTHSAGNRGGSDKESFFSFGQNAGAVRLLEASCCGSRAFSDVVGLAWICCLWNYTSKYALRRPNLERILIAFFLEEIPCFSLEVSGVPLSTNLFFSNSKSTDTRGFFCTVTSLHIRADGLSLPHSTRVERSSFKSRGNNCLK